ncbi:MAG: hypothetical protein LBI03_01995 [Clostridiales bacterium]|jgi:hypothetical protein|nr:hypothetical protein [Clostridiales bacterium]
MKEKTLPLPESEIQNNYNQEEKTIRASNEQDAVLRTIISPLFIQQDPITLIDAVGRIRSTEHTWVFDCLMPDFQIWLDNLPDEQITWLGDDCIHLAPIIAEKAFPQLKCGIALTIQSLGTDNPHVLAEGIFEYAKTKESLLIASLFAFGVVQLLLGSQFTFTQ